MELIIYTIIWLVVTPMVILGFYRMHKRKCEDEWIKGFEAGKEAENKRLKEEIIALRDSKA